MKSVSRSEASDYRTRTLLHKHLSALFMDVELRSTCLIILIALQCLALSVCELVLPARCYAKDSGIR